MNEVIRFPPQLRAVSDPVPGLIDYVARGRVHYAEFLRARSAMFSSWRRLVESGELPVDVLLAEANDDTVLLQILELLTAPIEPPPAA